MTRQHLLQAITEYDDRGADAFLAVYGFSPSADLLVHEGRGYDVPAVLGVAHRFATGRLAMPDEFHDLTGAVAILRKRGFEVTGPAAAATAPARGSRSSGSSPSRAPRATTARATTARTTKRAADEQPPATCPTCFTALPATGICDYCG